MKEMNKTDNRNRESRTSGLNEEMQELENLRTEMRELRSLVAGQQIVSERMIRRAMDTNLSQERKSVLLGIAMGLLGSAIGLFCLPVMGIPMWFCVLTVAFMFTAITASIYSLHKYMNINMAEEKLLDVATKVVSYKKFSNSWLKFSIPFLLVWLCLFFNLIAHRVQGDELKGMFYGGLVGMVIGITFGVIYLHKSRKRMNSILGQIKELQGEG